MLHGVGRRSAPRRLRDARPPRRRASGHHPRGSAGGAARALGRRVRPARGQPVRLLHARHRAPAGRARRDGSGEAAYAPATSRRPCAPTCAGAPVGSPSSKPRAVRWASTVAAGRPPAILGTRCWPPGAPRSRGRPFRARARTWSSAAGASPTTRRHPVRSSSWAADGRSPRAPRRPGRQRPRPGQEQHGAAVAPRRGARRRLGPHSADVLARARLCRAGRELVPPRRHPRLPAGERRRVRGQAPQPGARRRPGAGGRQRGGRPRPVAAGRRGATRAQAPASGRRTASRRDRPRPGRADGAFGRSRSRWWPGAGALPGRARSRWSTSPGRLCRPTCAARAGPRCWRRRPCSDAPPTLPRAAARSHVDVPGAGSARVELDLGGRAAWPRRGRRVGRRDPLSR